MRLVNNLPHRAFSFSVSRINSFSASNRFTAGNVSHQRHMLVAFHFLFVFWKSESDEIFVGTHLLTGRERAAAMKTLRGEVGFDDLGTFH